MNRIWAQCVKELEQFKRDKLTVALALVLPLLSLVLFGYAIRLEQKNIPVVVQNFDGSYLSKQYVDRLLNNEQMTLARWNGTDPFQPLDEGIAKAAITIPPEFGRRITQHIPAQVGVLIDAEDTNNAQVIRNSVFGTTTSFEETYGLAHVQGPIIPVVRLWFNPGRKESLYVVPGGFGLILWIYPSLLASLAMVKEKEQGTILQAYASSITAFEFVAGKAVAYLIVGIGMSVFILGLAAILFGTLPVTDPTPLLVCTVLYLLSSATYGLAIGSGVNTQGAAVQAVATTGFTTAFLLSGFIYPVRNIPWPLNYVSYILPARYYIIVARDAFVRGTGWSSDWFIPIFLIISIILFTFMGTKRLRGMQIRA